MVTTTVTTSFIGVSGLKIYSGLTYKRASVETIIVKLGTTCSEIVPSGVHHHGSSSYGMDSAIPVVPLLTNGGAPSSSSHEVRDVVASSCWYHSLRDCIRVFSSISIMDSSEGIGTKEGLVAIVGVAQDSYEEAMNTSSRRGVCVSISFVLMNFSNVMSNQTRRKKSTCVALVKKLLHHPCMLLLLPTTVLNLLKKSLPSTEVWLRGLNFTRFVLPSFTLWLTT